VVLVPTHIDEDVVLHYVPLSKPEKNEDGVSETVAYVLVRSATELSSERGAGDYLGTNLFCIEVDRDGNEIPYLNTWYEDEASFLRWVGELGLHAFTPGEEAPDPN
jgi:hypothetical protein